MRLLHSAGPALSYITYYIGNPRRVIEESLSPSSHVLRVDNQLKIESAIPSQIQQQEKKEGGRYRSTLEQAGLSPKISAFPDNKETLQGCGPSEGILFHLLDHIRALKRVHEEGGGLGILPRLAEHARVAPPIPRGGEPKV